ncbi:probable disease resistance protein At4g27220 isoform X2 [Mangifera indica]|uniref:probable disease resistance protein At4g27220 isoform X2 n=1 Tax=Mangifera indica TaxID=29780 RepID=UPI001CFBBEC1|nr:probable disease resistance protein At4g27220 isoform X2 [Mangifera indica]
MADVAGSIESVVSPVFEVGKWLVVPIWHQFKYLFNYTTNFKNLEKEVKKLKNTKEEVQDQVDAAERNLEKIKQNVKDWQKDVEKTIIEVDQLIQEKANNQRYSKGLCSNFIIHYKHSKKAFKLKRDDVDLLLQQGKELGPVSSRTNPLLEIWLRSSEDYVPFESRNSTMEEVWDALIDENIFMIGVYGMGGIGKTTLAQELGRKAKKDKLFEDIVFVEVSESPDIKKIQTAIADNLGLKFKNESERAKELYSRMEGKNILLILDNIWEPLEIEKTIGIPCRADRGRNKLLFTTRNLDVLERMDSTSNFGMGILTEEEAWILFTKMTDLFAGNIIQTYRLGSLPNDICKECRGLPIVICTIAKALKNKSHRSDWKVALQELKAPSPSYFTGFLEKEYTRIALSYTLLRDDELKKTLLIASLMENNASILDLFRHVVCLDILKGVNLTMEDVRDRLDKLVRDLKDACLLLDGFESGNFAMHDVVRVVAMRIAYMDHHVFTTRNDVEREWKDKDKLKKCTKISLSGDSTIISQLWPNDLDCPNLEYFYMTKLWYSSFEIPKDFFTVMPKLKVLNLVGLQQSLLPSSIGLLTNLQTLCLDYSNIEDVAVIGKFKKLKVLSLQGSCIKEFSTEMGQLTQLRLLDLSYCRQLKVIASNVISKLSQLEELYLNNYFIQWKIEVLKELKLLSSLTTLELHIEDDKVLPKGFFSRELIRYDILVGHWSFKYPLFDEHEHLRRLKLIIDPTTKLEELCVIKNVELLRLAEYLDDEGEDEDEDEKKDEDEDNLEHLKFKFQSNEITPLFNKKVICPDLMDLTLKNIISRKIWDDHLPSSSFQNLKQLTLWRCAKIKFVFPYAITKNLQQLQYLVIKDCIDLEEIVAIAEGLEAAANVVFPQVTVMVLENLPKLATFYPGINALEWPKLKELVVKDCQKFKMFTSEPKSLCLDQKINNDLAIFQLKDGLEEIGWDSSSKVLNISYYKSTHFPLGLPQRFENLTFLYVNHCHKLVNFTTTSIAGSLVQLKELSISDCSMLTEIVENNGDATTIEIVFEKLCKVSLNRLESLTCFCSKNYSFTFPSLKELFITECPSMNTFFKGISGNSELNLQSNEITPFFNEKVIFPNLKVLELINISLERIWDNQLSTSSSQNLTHLKELEVEDCHKFKMVASEPKPLCLDQKDISVDLKLLTLKDDNSIEICYNQHPTSFYQNLTHLTLRNCENIKYVFPSYIVKSLHQLQQLKIQNCKVLKEIIAKEDGATAVIDFVFPNITSLKLEDLPELTAFYLGKYTLELPKLKELLVKDCTKYLSFKKNNVETKHDILAPKSILQNNKINFNLELFQLYDGETNICWHGQFKTLTINKDNSANIPLRLFQRFENVRELRLFSNQYIDIKSPYDLPNLEVLDVYFHNRLMNLVLFSVFFQNLKVLKVSSCHGLMKLFTPSMARSLVQLRELSISYCKMLTEIVENEGDAITSSEIVFNSLNKLSLEWLYSLTCFCSGNYSFTFPSLEELKIENCVNLDIFCQGSLSTPKLDRVLYKSLGFHNEYVNVMTQAEIGENDLNTTIQQKHKKEIHHK